MAKDKISIQPKRTEKQISDDLFVMQQKQKKSFKDDKEYTDFWQKYDALLKEMEQAKKRR